VLSDQPQAANSALKLLPAAMRADVTAMIRITDAVFSSYIRGQLLLAVLIGAMAVTGLTLLGVPFPAVLALIAALFELLPFIGPLLGAIPAVLVAIVQSPLLGLWTAVLYLGIQQAENLFFAPRIAGNAVKLHPAIIMVVLVVGNELAGLWGVLLAVPLTAAVRDLYLYLYWRLQGGPLEPEAALSRLGRTQPTPAARRPGPAALKSV
jgi:predicted PurR-regulated permease PerM